MVLTEEAETSVYRRQGQEVRELNNLTKIFTTWKVDGAKKDCRIDAE